MISEDSPISFKIPPLPMTIDLIRQYLPHRYPFLFVDRVTAISEREITGYKNISINEEYLQGHFPDYPIMPGVYIVEALAQISGILGFLMNHQTAGDGSMFLFAGADKIRFKKPVIAGDQLTLHSEIIMRKRGIYKYNCTASVDGSIVATAEIMISHQVKDQL